jgi:ankyrin repeat protein
MRGVWVVLFVVGCAGASPIGPRSEPPSAGRAIAAALPLMQQSQQTWSSERDCTSCHHQGLGLTALVVAREHGFALDERQFALQRQYVQDDLDGLTDELATGSGLFGPVGVAYRAIGLATAGGGRTRASDLAVHYIAGKQAANGRWSLEVHRPPFEDSDLGTTALSLRALQLYAPEGRAPEMAERIARGARWLAAAPPRDTEDRAMQLLGLRWARAGRETITSRARELLAEQRADGGWAQLPTRASDAYATGEALVALYLAGELAADDPAYQRGVRFLVGTQERDGSWHVVTRRKIDGLPYFETGFPHGADQFISFAGTAWAVIALAYSDGRAADTALVRDPVEPAPRAMDPLSIVLFGSVPALDQLLERGLDSSTGDGRLAIVASAFDVRRSSKVLARGGNAVLRAADNQTMLHVAAGYSGARASVELLLAGGADPNVVDDEGLAPLARAAGAGGDLARVKLLLDAGAERDHRATDGGAALGWAQGNTDLEVLTLLVDRGAPVTGKDYLARPLLSSSVIDRSLPLVEMFLARGAQVDERDGLGYTALHWAATVDSGSTKLVETLLRAGADPTATTPDGATPLVLAKRHGNRHVEPLLRAAEQRARP